MSLRHDITDALRGAALRMRARAGQVIHDQLVIDIAAVLNSDATRRQVARVARGEVKDYLMILAEGAGMAFGGPQNFLTDVEERAKAVGLTVVRQDLDAPYQPGREHEWRLVARDGQLVAVPYEAAPFYWPSQPLADTWQDGTPVLDERGQD